MARQNDLRTREEAQVDYNVACEIQNTITQMLIDLRDKLLRVSQDKVEAHERLQVLDREYQS